MRAVCRHREMPSAPPVDMVAGATASLSSLETTGAQERIQVLEPDVARVSFDLLSPFVPLSHQRSGPEEHDTIYGSKREGLFASHGDQRERSVPIT